MISAYQYTIKAVDLKCMNASGRL